MTIPDEPTADTEHAATGDPRERMWERIRNVDRDWSPERGRTASQPSQVLVPFDDSKPACAALEYAFELFPNADVTALTIVNSSMIAYGPASGNNRHLGAENDLLAGVPVELEHAIEIADHYEKRIRTAAQVGTPTRGILESLESESADHVVIGSHCRSGLTRVLQGSVAEIVVRHSPVPVTVVRVPADGGG